MPQSNGKNLLKRFEFEFKGNSYCFILNPEEYQQTEISRSTITQTMGGGWIDAFGAGLMEITLKGSTGFKNTSGNPSDGFERFKQLRDLIRSVYSNVKMGEEVKDLMKFYNYTDNEYWEVYPSRFQLMRSKSKPLLYMYDIQLTALRQLSDAKPYNGRIGNPFVVQSTVMETNDMNVSTENIENSNIIEDISLLETLPVFNLFPKLRDRIAKSISHFSSKVIDVISQGVKNEELLSDFNTLLVVGNNIAELVGGTNGLISPAVSKYILSGLNILNNGTATNLQDNENQNKPNENKDLKRTFLLNNFYSEQTDQSSKNSNTELGTVELYFVPQVSRKAYTLFKELKSLNPEYFQLDKFIPLITDYIPTDKQVEKENLVSLIANLDNQAIDSSIVKYMREEETNINVDDLKRIKMILLDALSLYTDIYKFNTRTIKVIDLSKEEINTLLNNVKYITTKLERLENPPIITIRELRKLHINLTILYNINGLYDTGNVSNFKDFVISTGGKI